MSTIPIIEENVFLPQKMLISVTDYHRMGAAGIFENKPKVELLDGEIYIKSTDGQKMLISVADYQRMGAAGIFENKPRVELLDGIIYTMSPITPNHNGHVDKVAEFFTIKLFGKAKVRTQGSIKTSDYSEPEPDISILRYDEHFYTKKQATAADVHLIIEVAVFTVKTDRTIKKKKYAKAGIPAYWIVIPQKGIIEVYKQPADGNYAQKSTYKINSQWTIDAFDLAVKGSDFLIP
ncbi:MAG: Uma2 family endonuclease [Saprospiraceae bacterium]